HDALPICRQSEDTLDVGLQSPRAHDPGPRPAPEQQVQRLREHRLARPRLAGEDVEPGAQTQLRPLDEEQVLDTQFVEHAGTCTGAARRNTRSRALRPACRTSRAAAGRTSTPAAAPAPPPRP